MKHQLMGYYFVTYLFCLFCLVACKQETKPSYSTDYKTVKLEKEIRSLLEKSEKELSTDLLKSLETAQEATKKSDRISDNLLKYEVYSAIGRIFFQIGLFDKSSDYFLIADSLARRTQNELFIAKTNFNLSALNFAVGNYTQAEIFLKKAAPFFETKKHDPNFSTYQHSVLNNRALILENTHRLKSAEAYYQSAMAYAKKINYVDGLKTTLSALGNYYLNQSRYHESEACLTELLLINNQNNYTSQLEATTLLRLQRVKRSLGETAEANLLLTKGNELAKSTHSISLMREYANDIYLSEKEKGNTALALESKEYYDSLVKQENKATVSRQMELETIKKQFEQKEALMRKELGQSSTLFFIIAAVFLLALLSGVYLIVKKTKNEQQLKRAKQSIEKLHFQLSTSHAKLAEELSKKDRELTTEALKSLRKKETITDSLTKLHANLNELDKDTLKAEIGKLHKRLNTDELWNSFEIRFNEVNENFFEKLNQHCPHLTINEKRLCAFLKLDFTTKEITALTGQTVRAVEIARTRLRKKLGLTQSNISVSRFLSEL